MLQHPNNPGEVFLFVFNIVVRGVLVPAVLLILLVISWLVAYRSQSANPSQRMSKLLAFWFGVALFIIVVVSTLFVGPATAIGFDGTAADFAFLAGLGVALGLLVMFAVDVLIRIRAASIFIAVLSSTSLIGLYYYALTVASRNPVLIIVLGMLVGGLFYGAFVHAPDLMNYIQLRNVIRVTVGIMILAIVVATLVGLLALSGAGNSPGGPSSPTPTLSSFRPPPPTGQPTKLS